MKISDQAESIRQSLQTWAQPKGGVASVCYDLQEMWETAYKATDKPRLLLTYAGEDVRSEFSIAAATHRVDRKWQLAATRGKGFTANRGTPLTTTVQNAEPFYNYVEEVRDLVRALDGITEELPVDYTGIEPMPAIGGRLIAGYIIHFSTANDLPAIAPIPDSLQPSPLDQP